MSVDWIAADWGTSRLRVWALDAAGKVLSQTQSDRGMATLRSEEYEAALLDLAGPMLAGEGPLPVIVCGMAGARGGWLEAPYQAAPCAPPGPGAAVRPALAGTRLSVHILPGVSQATPPDVMRGEETQIAGFLRAEPGFDGVLAMPGTHTKWVRISAGEIVGFRTFMTGELFALLGRHSVLKPAVTDQTPVPEAFLDGVSEAMARPEALANRLFSLRAAHLLSISQAGAARARLSGLLIGAELAGSRPFWLGQYVVVVDNGAQARNYRLALESLGLSPRMAAAEGLTQDGLRAARAALSSA